MWSYFKKKIIHLMKKIIINHEQKNVYICTNFDVRNRYKNEKYKIPHDKPQCPIFEDNRCCGSCDLAPSCDHCVNCNCYGYTKARMGGTDSGYFLHKCSDYYAEGGRLDENGKFDWEHYKKLKKWNWE